MLNKDVFKMIAHAQRENVGTNLSSNLVNTDSRDIDRLLDSGLEYLIVSLDGTTQENYQKYRVRGDIDRVRKNLEELLTKRARRNLKTPVVEWQFIVMKHNEHEIERGRAHVRRDGRRRDAVHPGGPAVRSAESQPAGCGVVSTKPWKAVSIATPSNRPFGQDGRPGPCYYLYRSMTINPDGGVSPCCIVYKQERDFANLNDGDQNRGHLEQR